MPAPPESFGTSYEPDTAPFSGRVLLVAPHMDDETLGCGALLARFPGDAAVDVVFATDGARSPEPPHERGRHAAELREVRRQEALEAMAVLGVDARSVHFLDLPDGALTRHTGRLGEALAALVAALAPTHLLVPFRYDRHPDHLAVNQAGVAIASDARDLTLVEYFVYAKWRLLPSGDLRTYVRTDRVLRVEPETAGRKRRALACYRSQTTLFYAWQHRPILTPTLVDRVCNEPEMFLVTAPAALSDPVFDRVRPWIPVAHRLEPWLKHGKDRFAGWLHR